MAVTKTWQGPAVIENGGHQPPDVVTEEGLKQALSGVRDGVKTLIADAKKSLLLSVGKALDDRVKRKALEVIDTLRKDVSAYVDRAEASLKGQVEAALKDRLETAVKAYEQSRAEIDAFLRSQGQVLERIESMIKSLPVPVINVGSPNVSVAAADVKFMPQINVPEQQAPVVHVAAPNVSVSPEFKSIVNVPEYPAPVFNVPEVKASEVKIEFPKRKVTKTIGYDEQGRPQTVTEEEG